MSYASNDEIRGVLIQAGNERVLLPNATVAEMMSRVPVQPVSDAPRWLVGEIGWHGWQVPLVSFARLSGLGEETVAGHNKVVVLKSLSGNAQRPYYALLTQNFPQLIWCRATACWPTPPKKPCRRPCTCACCWVSRVHCCRTWTRWKQRWIRSPPDLPDR